MYDLSKTPWEKENRSQTRTNHWFVISPFKLYTYSMHFGASRPRVYQSGLLSGASHYEARDHCEALPQALLKQRR